MKGHVHGESGRCSEDPVSILGLLPGAIQMVGVSGQRNGLKQGDQ